METNKETCVFCLNKFKPEEKFKVDYKLVAWSDDPNDPESLNKLAKLAHNKCFDKFISLNISNIMEVILGRLNQPDLINDNIN